MSTVALAEGSWLFPDRDRNFVSSGGHPRGESSVANKRRGDVMQKGSFILSILVVVGLGLNAFAQQDAASLLFREDFKEGPAGQVQLTQDAVTNPNLELMVYGPGSRPGVGRDSGLLLGNEGDPTNPGAVVSVVYTGVAQGIWGVMLKDKNNALDLSGTGRIRWRVRQRSLHQIRPLIKLTDGTLLVGDYEEPLSTYLRESEVFLVDVHRWRPLNPETMFEAGNVRGQPLWKTGVDLSNIDEVGFTTLTSGAGHGTSGNLIVDWIEVYGSPVER